MAPALNEQDLLAAIGNATRLEALNASHLLDTPAEAAFDRITKLAARLLDVPVTFIALVDSEKDFYKSFFGFGLPLSEARNLKGRTFCHYTIASGEPLVIPDTLAHPVYSQVPTVKSLGIGAYLGIPLKAVGNQIIGSLCAVDVRPRAWTGEHIEALTELSLSASREIDLRIVSSEALRNAKLALENIRAKEEVLAVVAHDLRNPLNVLALVAARLTQTHAAALRPLLELMDRANQQMTSTIGELLEVEAFSRGRIELTRADVRTDMLLADAMKLAVPLAQQKAIVLSQTGAPVHAAVCVDYARILRVFANLIGNAIKFSSESREIHVCAEDDGDKVKFRVRDFGEGIDADKIDKVFERYWQGTGGDPRGVGLGLGIAKAIVEKHEGEIGVESERGHGSTFWFTLPKAFRP